MKQYTIERIEKEGMIVFSAIMGSHAYGTNLPTSDTDIRGIFIQPLEDILGFGKVDQVADEKNDIIYYEIGRFLDLLKSNNPNILELLNVPEDCIRINKGIMKFVFDHKDKFLTKKCRWSFGGYAVEQIKKARGLNKKMNWEENEMVRKTVLDFCYILVDGGSKPFKEWLNNWNERYLSERTQKHFGLAAIDHGHDLYAMYLMAKNLHLHKISNGEWGIVSNEETSNDVQFTSIPKELPIRGYLYFNKDGYSSHCKKYKEYLEWLEHRNETRVNMAKAHGKKYDGKNLMHTFRLLETALEIATEGTLNVRRKNIDKLLSIRRGEYEYDQLLIEAEELITKMDKAFEESKLPTSVNTDFINDLLVSIRKSWYNL